MKKVDQILESLARIETQLGTIPKPAPPPGTEERTRIDLSWLMNARSQDWTRVLADHGATLRDATTHHSRFSVYISQLFISQLGRVKVNMLGEMMAHLAYETTLTREGDIFELQVSMEDLDLIERLSEGLKKAAWVRFKNPQSMFVLTAGLMDRTMVLHGPLGTRATVPVSDGVF